ncbi:MAG: hypothetical protein LC127_13880, partial [Chitinophagales bacterium]|nr:hypothetical protein [Chitinophagales bacterium]
NAIEFSTGVAQKSWIQQALKDLPELINLTGQEADAVERTTDALRNRQTIADIESERARNLAEIAKLEEQFIASNKGTLQLTKEQSDVLFANVNALRDQNTELNQRLGLLNAELNETIKIEGEKKKAADDAKKAQEDAAKRRIEQIKNERKEIQDLLKVTKDETLRNAQDVNFQLREIEARRITNRFEQAKALEQISIERTEAELKSQRDAAIKEVNETILSTTEKEKARKQITDEYNKQIEDAKKISSTNIVSIEKEQNAQIKLAGDALRTELNFGDANFTDTIENRALESVQFENELNQRKLQDGVILNRLSLAQQEEYYKQLQALQNSQLELEKQQRLNANEATLRQELQLAKDREEIGDITAAQLAVIETNLRQTKAIEDEKVEKDIAQKRIAINKQTEEQILQTRIQSLQAYLAAATTSLQALASVSQAVEQNQLNAITERTNTELNANQQKNQSILDQELAVLMLETTNEADKVKKRDAAIKKSQQQKANDDQKTEEKIEKQRNEIRKKAFARTKALNIATALVNGAQAVLSAIAQFGPPPSPLGIAGIAAAGVLTAAQVAAISSQQYQEEGGGPSRELSVPETAGVGEVAGAAGPPSGGFTLFNPDLVNVTQTGGRGAAGGGGTMGPLRVIVVESDITDAQKSVRTTVDQASFG